MASKDVGPRLELQQDRAVASHRDPEWLLGRQFECRFRVVGVGAATVDPDDRVVALHMHGERAEISLGELATLVERGFVVESGPVAGGGKC